MASQNTLELALAQPNGPGWLNSVLRFVGQRPHVPL